MKNNIHISTTLLLLLCISMAQVANAQSSTARKETRKGNKEYKQEHFDKAEINYRRALHDDSTAYRAHYNLGNTLYRQKKYDEAASHYEQALSTPDLNAKTRSKILHNRGNCNLKNGLGKENRAEGMQQFQQAVNDYQEALKLDPKNDDTRYNLSYAKKLLQQAQQQQQQQGGGKDNQNQDQNKDNKDQQGNNGQNQQKDQQEQNDQKDQKGQQNQQNQPQNKKDREQQKRQQQQQQQKKKDAERLLEAVKNNEKNTMKENAKHVEAASSNKIEKDW